MNSLTIRFIVRGVWVVCSAVLLLGLGTASPHGILGAGSTQSATVAATEASTPAATATPPNPVTENAKWTPQARDFGGVPMLLVPPGCYLMGDENGLDDEKPATKVCFDQPFWIDKTEVTQAQFAELSGVAAKAPKFKGDNLPVEQISWFEASDFCAKRGGRLPTEAEWEYAARGPDDLVYPWGNTFDGSKLVYSRPGQGPKDVGSVPSGASWVGALDMSGNVWEWNNSIYKPYPYQADDGREDPKDRDSMRTLRGGSFGGADKDYKGDKAPGRLAARQKITPNFTSPDIGFRCMRSFY